MEFITDVPKQFCMILIDFNTTNMLAKYTRREIKLPKAGGCED